VFFLSVIKAFVIQDGKKSSAIHMKPSNWKRLYTILLSGWFLEEYRFKDKYLTLFELAAPNFPSKQFGTMTEHIQPLLDRIQSEGLKKAEAEREALLEQARAEAGQLRAAAEKEAEALRAKAESDAEASLARGRTSLEQAARDTLLQFRSELNRQLETLARSAAAATLSSADQVAPLLGKLLESGKGNGKGLVETSPDLAKDLEPLLPALLKELGSEQGAELVLNPRTGAGFTLRFEDSAAVADVTDEAVAAWLSTHLRPELAALLKSQAGK
jgi:vacuolar-type H+-ATPase subunit E/Vma4